MIALKVWILRIAGARPADSGLYQCQVLLLVLMVNIVIKMIIIFIMIILIFVIFLPVDYTSVSEFHGDDHKDEDHSCHYGDDHDYIDNDQFLIKLIFTMMSAQVNTEPTISRSIKLIVRSGSEGTRPREKVSGDNLANNAIIL